MRHSIKSKKLSLILLLLPIIYACGSDSSSTADENQGNVKPESGGSGSNGNDAILGEIQSIQANYSEFENNTEQNYLPRQLKAMSKNTNGETTDITTLVNWHSSDESVVQINAKGIAQPLNAGKSSVHATLGGNHSGEMTYVVPPSMICGHNIGALHEQDGGGLNDEDTTLTKGNCLAVNTVSLNNKHYYLTSSPSEDFLLANGFALRGSKTSDVGYYTDTNTENGGKFAMFEKPCLEPIGSKQSLGF